MAIKSAFEFVDIGPALEQLQLFIIYLANAEKNFLESHGLTISN